MSLICIWWVKECLVQFVWDTSDLAYLNLLVLPPAFPVLFPNELGAQLTVMVSLDLAAVFTQVEQVERCNYLSQGENH